MYLPRVLPIPRRAASPIYGAEMNDDYTRAARRRKIFALAAGGAALGLGVSATLAAWTDTEWVFGGSGSDGSGPGVGTTLFEVQQNVDFAAGGVIDDSKWADRETPGGAGRLTFTADPLALQPGDVVYAPVALRTATDSVDGDVLLQPAQIGGTDSAALAAALDVSVVTAPGSFVCDATAFSSVPAGGAVIVSDAALGADGAALAQTLSGATADDAGAPRTYCFRIALPATSETQNNSALMGQTVTPRWEFTAQS